jgi:tetratricopeptide (TPR) repeat protein
MTSTPEPWTRPDLREALVVGPDTAILCALIVAGPQMFGGAFAWSVVAIAGLSLVALAAALWVRRASPHPVIDGVLVVMGLAWVWTCIQVLPLPETVARALRLGSVQSAQTLQGLEWAGQIPLTVSRDPGSTLLQIIVGIAILAAFLAARLGGLSGLKPIAGATVVSALLLGFEGLAHRLSGAEAMFGIYAPRFTQPQLLTPLMNGNHLGGFALMGALLAAGLSVQRSAPSKRFWSFASILCAFTVAATLSRGAIGSLFFGFVLLTSWLVGRRTERRRSVIPVAVLVAAVAGTGAFLGLEPILRRFEAQGFDKLAVAARGFRLLEGPTWWLGIGRGAFSSAFVSEEGSLARYTHPENLVVQWTTEWGVVVGLALLVVLGVALWKRLRGAKEPIVAAACVAILALSLQNLVDFSLEMAGIVVVAASLLGALLPAAPTDASSERSLRLPTTALLGFAALLALVAPRVLDSDVQSIVDRLTLAMEHDREADFRATLRRGLSLHPTEPALALLAGTYAGSKQHQDAPRWLSIVMEEAPGWAAPHVLAAQWLFERGRLDQALLEIREAEERHPGSGQKALCQVIARFPSMEYLERAAPSTELRPAYLDRASACPGLPAPLRAEIDEAILQSEPARVNAVLRHVRRLVSQKRSEQAMALLEQALAHHPNDVSLWVAIIQAHLSNQDLEAARSALNEARSRDLESRSLTDTQARLEAALGQTDEMRATITRLRGQSLGDLHKVAATFMLQGELEASLGHIDEALAAYAAADAASPETPALQRAAELALKSGRPSRARRIYRTLCSRNPEGPACAKAAGLGKERREVPVRPPMP